MALYVALRSSILARSTLSIATQKPVIASSVSVALSRSATVTGRFASSSSSSSSPPPSIAPIDAMRSMLAPELALRSSASFFEPSPLREGCGLAAAARSAASFARRSASAAAAAAAAASSAGSGSGWNSSSPSREPRDPRRAFGAGALASSSFAAAPDSALASGTSSGSGVMSRPLPPGGQMTLTCALALFAPDGPAAMPLRDELPETFDVMPARDRLFATSRDAPFFGAISRGARGV